MAEPSVLNADPRIMEARGLMMVHQIEEAEALYRKILEADPGTPEALNFIAMCELGRGNFATARDHLERALELDPNEEDLWKNYGIVLLAQNRAQDAVDAFDRVLSMEPKSLAVRLHRAAALERMGRAYDAAAAYECALSMAQMGGRWRSEATTPAELRPVVKHAMSYLIRERKRIFMELMQPARARYGARSIARVEQGLSVYLGDAAAEYADPRQDCSFFCVPGLSAEPFLDVASIPGMTRLAARHELLCTEFDAVRTKDMAWEPYFGTHDLALLRQQSVLDGSDGARVEAFFLYRRGRAEPMGQRACPGSFAAVSALPQPVRIPELGPDAFFLTVTPGTQVLKSHAITNARVSVELPLRVRGTCVRGVAGVARSWREGQCIAYDASFEHGLRNSDAGACSALVIDAWHPGLSAAERAALTLLFDGIREFDSLANVASPFGSS